MATARPISASTTQTAGHFLIDFSGGGSESPTLGVAAHANVPVPSVYLGSSRIKPAATRSALPAPSTFDLAASARTFGVSASVVSNPSARAEAAVAGAAAVSIAARPAQTIDPLVNPWGML